MIPTHLEKLCSELERADVIYETHKVTWDSSTGPIIDTDVDGEIVYRNHPESDNFKYSAIEDFSSFNGFNLLWQYKKHLLHLTSNATIEVGMLYRNCNLGIDELLEKDTIAKQIIDRLKSVRAILKTNHNKNLQYKNLSSVHGQKGFKPDWTNAYQFTELQRMALRSITETFKNLFFLYKVEQDNIEEIGVQGKGRLVLNLKAITVGSEKFKSFYANLKADSYITDKRIEFADKFSNPQSKSKIRWNGTAGELSYLVRKLINNKNNFLLDVEGVGIWKACLNTFCQSDGFDFRDEDSLHRSSQPSQQQKMKIDKIVSTLA